MEAEWKQKLIFCQLCVNKHSYSSDMKYKGNHYKGNHRVSCRSVCEHILLVKIAFDCCPSKAIDLQDKSISENVC